MRILRNLWLLIFVLLSVNQLVAQNSINNFKTLQSQGQVPADLRKITTQDKEWIDYNTLLKWMVMEGRVLYGTPLNDYVDRIADNLLKNEPDLRATIHIYLVKSPEVNAYATRNGIVLLNLGTLAQVSNESELAFIIGHEIAHIAQHHSAQNGDKKDKSDDAIDYYVKTQNRSRNQEFEADRLALERFFSQSTYSYSVMEGVFDVLQYADLPFNEIPFPKSLVQTDFYQFPDNYFLANVAPITSRADMVDTLFTHPNIEKRRAAARAALLKLSNEGRSVFVQPESLFYEIRELARFECINYYLTEHQFDQAFYNAYVLLQNRPDNKFLNEALAAAVYGFSKHKNYGTPSEVISNYKKVEGEMQQTCYFLSKLTRQESSLLALRLAWKAREKNPDNAYLADILEDAIRDVFVKNKMKFQDFSDFAMGSQPDSSAINSLAAGQVATSDAPAGKYDRIKQQNKKNIVFPSEKFKTANFMLVDIHQNDDFIALVNAVVNQAEDEVILDVVAQNEPANVKAMVIAEPQYVAKKGGEMLVNASNKGAQRVQKNFSRCLHKLKVESVTYSAKEVCGFSANQFNGFSELQTWLREYQQSEGIEMVHYTAQDMALAADLTQTSTVGIAAVKRSKDGFMSLDKSNHLAAAVLCPYALPFSVTLLALPRYKTETCLVVADFKTGKTLLGARNIQASSMSDAYVNAFLYDQLFSFIKGK